MLGAIYYSIRYLCANEIHVRQIVKKDQEER